jgi:hypothetical protein
MTRSILFALAACAGFLVAQVSDASVQVWNVSSATTDISSPAPDSIPAPHGLWTNNYIGGTTGYLNYFDFQADMTLTQDLIAGTATLAGTAKNLAGTTATLDLNLDGFLNALPNPGDYKAGGGPYDALTQDFYSTLSGTITFDDGVATETINILSVMANTYFQMGDGANDKNGNLGASAWVMPADQSGNQLSHWDVNLNLQLAPSTVVDAPEAASLLIWGLLSASVVTTRRKPLND